MWQLNRPYILCFIVDIVFIVLDIQWARSFWFHCRSWCHHWRNNFTFLATVTGWAFTFELSIIFSQRCTFPVIFAGVWVFFAVIEFCWMEDRIRKIAGEKAKINYNLRSSQSIPPHPVLQLHSHGRRQSPFLHPGYGWHFEQFSPVQPILQLDNKI